MSSAPGRRESFQDRRDARRIREKLQQVAEDGVNWWVYRLIGAERLDVSYTDIQNMTVGDVHDHHQTLDFWELVDEVQRERQQREVEKARKQTNQQTPSAFKS